MPFTKHFSLVAAVAAALSVGSWGAPRSAGEHDSRRAKFSGERLTTDVDVGVEQDAARARVGVDDERQANRLSSSSSHSSLMRREVSSAGSTGTDGGSAKINSTANGTGSIDTLANASRGNSTHDTGAKVAICFSGLLRGLTEKSPGRNFSLNENIRKNLLEALGEKADIFVAGPPYPGMTADMTRQLLAPLGAAELRLHGEPRVETLWAEAYATIPADAFSVVETFGDTGGSSMFGPVFGNGYGVYEWYWRDHCLDMLQQKERAQGREYERVIATRYDMQYLTHHPPLNLMDPRSVWVPNGQDETGYNDHHAVIPRKNASVWLGVWKSLLSGEVAEYLKKPTMLSSWRNPETLLKHIAFHNKLDVRHFPPVAAIINCPGTGDFHCTFGSCNRKKYKDFKSCDEAEAVFKVAAKIEKSNGWNLDILQHFF